MTTMKTWISKTIGRDSLRDVSKRSGIGLSTLSRRLPDDLTPEQVISLAHAYDVPAIEGLVAAGYLTEADVIDVAGHSALSDATDAQLAEEVLRRMKLGGESAQVFDLPISRVGGMDEDERRAASHDQGGLEESDLD